MMTRGLADQAKLASVQEEIDMLSDKSDEFVAQKSQRTKMTPVRSEQPGIAAVGGPEQPMFAKGYESHTDSEVVQPQDKLPPVDNCDGFWDNIKPVSKHFIKLQRRESN